MTGWQDLARELDSWCDAGRIATFWWRDDDAAHPTPALATLLDLRKALSVPLALAVIPEKFSPDMRRNIEHEPELAVLQHGYTHHNFAESGARKIELDDSRPAAYVVAELAVGMGNLSGLANWLPVLVPPWNRIAPHLLPFLPELGFRGISTIGARARLRAMPGLTQHNVHVDIIDWRGRDGRQPGTLSEENALQTTVAHLAARRSGAADSAEATGLMTHHLVHDAPAWAFTRRFIETTLAHPAVRWLRAGELFEGAS